MTDERWWEVVSGEQRELLAVLWGKSDVGGQPHLLLQHLFDTLAVAEVMWDEFLADSIRRRFDAVAGPAGGRALFSWICGVHDIGKATPAFQMLVPELGARVHAAGLETATRRSKGGWRHDRAGGAHLFHELPGVLGRKTFDASIAWLWPLVAGHHGRFPPLADVSLKGDGADSRNVNQGTDHRWAALRTKLLEIVALASGHESLSAVAPVATPTRGEQLVISGLMVMADWIASGDHFGAIGSLDDVGVNAARTRARNAWRTIGIGGGWRDLDAPPLDLFAQRFLNEPRAVQTLAVSLASEMATAGLMIVEAPMGEGKTELALAVSEVFGHRFGCGGVAVALPTQATSDAMFARVEPWLERLGGDSQLALLHGKRLVNDDWRRLVDRVREAKVTSQSDLSLLVDEFGLPDDLGIVRGVCEDCDASDPIDTGVNAAAEWLLGRYRGMLAANFVGTIDQLLFAATRTKFVSLRFSGLGGKVVVIDEVHAADEYMSEFLTELLEWLGSAGIPVVLLSATLSLDQRESLVRSYLGVGELGDVDAAARERVGYPQITVAERSGANGVVSVHGCDGSRTPQHVTVKPLTGFDDDADGRLLDAIDAEVGAGGVALVIRNTVARAQRLFDLLRARYGNDVQLLHSRFTAGHRADDTARVVRLIGPPHRRPDGSTDDLSRPRRYIVVATQVAEQSFDVDADVLFSDLAPIDLLLQRVGRLHRHERERPAHLSTPTLYVTAMPQDVEGQTHLVERGGAAVYGAHQLLCAATMVRAATDDGWLLPQGIPVLVDAAYSDDPPMVAAWREAADASRTELERARAKRVSSAKQYRLDDGRPKNAATLEGLHTMANLGVDADRHVRVRDSDHESLEVVLVQRTDRGFHSLGGKELGINGEIARDDPALVLGSLVRIPELDRGALHREVQSAAVDVSEWKNHPWLGQSTVLIVENGVIRLPNYLVTYDRLVGLTVERAGR